MGFLKRARFSVSYKTRNHSQIIQTTHKPPKKHPQTSHTTHKPVKTPTNQPNTSKPSTNQPKIASFFPCIQDPRTATFATPHNMTLLHILCKKRNGCILLYSCQIFHFTFSIAQFLTIPNCRLQS